MAKNSSMVSSGSDKPEKLDKIFVKEQGGVQTDTDSVYVGFYPFMRDIIGRELTDEELVDFMTDLDTDIVSAFFIKAYNWRAKQQNLVNRLHFKRERIASDFVSLGKKVYSMRMLVEEDKIFLGKPKLKSKGIDIVKSSTPPFCKSRFEELIFEILKDTATYRHINSLLIDIYQEFIKADINDIARVSNIKKYAEYAKTMDEYDKFGLHFTGATPIATRAAIVYNFILHKLEMPEFAVNENSKIKYCYVKPTNRFQTEVVAWDDDFPEQFRDLFEVDNRTQFEKSFLSLINRFATVRGWPQFQVQRVKSFFR